MSNSPLDDSALQSGSNATDQVTVAPVTTQQAREPKSRGEQKRPRNYVIDLKIRTPASLVGQAGLDGVDAAPALVRLAKVKGIDVLGITDFYCGRFVGLVQKAAQSKSVTVIPGVELRCQVGTCDDIIISCLFPEHFSPSDIEAFLRTIDVPTTAARNSSFIVKRSLGQVIHAVEQNRGIAFPSRIDKTPHRLLALPALVEEYGFRTFDLTYNDSARIFRTRWPELEFQLFSFSNAQALAQVGSRALTIKLKEPSFSCLKSIMQRDGLSKVCE